MISIMFNNEPREIADNMSIARLMEEAGMTAPNMAVAVNGQVVPKDAWTSAILKNGDSLLVIKAFYGG